MKLEMEQVKEEIQEAGVGDVGEAGVRMMKALI